MLILGIESSCDETAASVSRDGREILSNVVLSQVDMHAIYGGVVPEIASRSHVEGIHGVVSRALEDAGVTVADLDAIAVTYAPGLIGALLVGVNFAKGLAFSAGKPLVPVHHIRGHISANYIAFPELQPPFTCLVVSGGHSLIADVRTYTEMTILGSTRDDAAGEAFDKAARVLGLPYPGGPEIDRLAKKGRPVIKFYHVHKTVNADLSLSYSGLKTAVVNYLHNAEQRGEQVIKEDVCASVTQEAVSLLTDTVFEAARRAGRKTVVLAGGVAANSFLRSALFERGKKEGCEVLFPQPVYCTDNAVMIASRGYFSIREGKDLADLSLNAQPSLRTGV